MKAATTATTTKKKEERPWGWFEQFNKNDPCTVKLIHVKAGSRLSLQYHEKRREFWKVVKGPAIVQIDGKTFTGKPGDEFEIPTRAKHRLAAKSSSDAIILEISYGHFDEDDIVRIEDDFGRTKKKNDGNEDKEDDDEVLYASTSGSVSS